LFLPPVESTSLAEVSAAVSSSQTMIRGYRPNLARYVTADWHANEPLLDLVCFCSPALQAMRFCSYDRQSTMM